MFTGIIEEVGEVVSRQASALQVRARDVLRETKLGDSISVNGACLTVTELGARDFQVGLSPETIRRTNTRNLRAGDKVNLERALRVGDRLGGHFVQGHVDATVELRAIQAEEESLVLSFELPMGFHKYVVEKGFVALDGISLTVTAVQESSFSVTLIPFTIKNVSLGGKKPGYAANLEVDILGKYVERALAARVPRGGVTEELLERYGFK